MKKNICILLFLFATFTIYSNNTDYSTVMFRLKEKRVKLSENVREVIRMGVEEILTKKGYLLISEKNQEMALEQMKSDHKNDCYDDSCLIDAGGMLSARGVFLVEVIKLGDKFPFKLKYLDMETAAVIKTKSMIYKFKLDNADELLKFSKNIAKEMFKVELANTTINIKNNKNKDNMTFIKSLIITIFENGDK